MRRQHATAKLTQRPKNRMAPSMTQIALADPPPWVDAIVAGSLLDVTEPSDGLRVAVSECPPFGLVHAAWSGVDELDPQQFQCMVTETYLALHKAAQAMAVARQPVRVWNWVPAINRVVDDRRDRYMVFNAGRFDAFRQWFVGEDALERAAPAASAVGHSEDRFAVHMLTCSQPGKPLENPRQCSSYRYSKRFGPVPPCFARATLLPGIGAHGFGPTPDLARGSGEQGGDAMRTLLIAGTASIRGEDSVHAHSLDEQVGETLANLEAVTRRAGMSLSNITHARAYYRHESDRAAVEATVREALPSAATVEPVHAQVCRPELLVEVEAIAHG